MDYQEVEALRRRHPAWRLLAAHHAPLLLSFLGTHFVERARGATPAGELAGALDDELYRHNAESPDSPPFPKPAAEYLAEWASGESGFLRRFYPLGSDEIHYDGTPALEKAYGWVQSLHVRPFVGTESRLQTAFELLRQISQGTEQDPEVRLAELRRRRRELDAQIEELEGDPASGMLDLPAVRDRYQQFA